MIEVKGLNKSFGGKMVLNDINFKITRGEITAIVGESGRGKTTLLRCINGLERCDSGEIIIDGKYLVRQEGKGTIYASQRELKEIRKSIGLVFQEFNLFPHKTVMENIIEAPVYVYGVEKGAAKESAIEILSLLRLEDKVDSYPFELSGGQKQRAAIARACALNPEVLCLDEPTSALDPGLRDEVASIIRSLSQRGITVIFISHDMEFVKRASDRVISI